MLKKYTFEEMVIGTSHSFEVEITEELQKGFLGISGDVSTLHVNEDFAKSRGFKGRVVYGMLVSSFYSTLVGVYLPGENCLLQDIHVKFRKPVYIGDKLIVSGRVTERNDTFKQATVSAEIRNSNGEKVSNAVIKVGVLSE